MKFILNFIFFGILFYLIWAYFPDAFQTLFSWANHIVTFFKDLFSTGVDRVKHISSPPVEVPHTLINFIR